MKIFYSEEHRKHFPPFEVYDGGRHMPYMESPSRVDMILAALKETDWAEIQEPVDFGLEPILAVHDEDYINFLSSAWTEWLDTEPEAAANPEQSIFLPATFALRRQPPKQTNLLGKAGYYMMDLSACIVGGTYQAAMSSSNCALSAASYTLNDNKHTFALCRPPGHHAGKDYAGGFCFINNASVAANWLSNKGKVALLDVDYHAGNGTQDIFYERSDVLTISIHGDVEFEYPHYIGFAEETGAGDGLGFHKNHPLPKGTNDVKYLETLDESLKAIRKFEPQYLVLSLGADIFDGDPLGTFKVTNEGFGEIGKRIASLRIPTTIIMEGGYAIDALGNNVLKVLENFK